MTNYRASLEILNLKGRQVVVAGGSNGIGRSLAILYASLGCSVAIIGRTPSAGQDVLSELKKIQSKEARVSFIQADLSVVKGMHKAAEDVRIWAGEQGVHYLFQTQGIAPPATPILTSDSIEVSFATQAVSRFALPYLLFSTNTLRDTSIICNIAIAGLGQNYQPSPDDIDLSEHDKVSQAGFTQRNQNAAAVIDCFTKQLSILHPKAKIYHVWPGGVKTSIISRTPNAPLWMKIGSSIGSFIPGLMSSPDDTALVGAYIASGLAGEETGSASLCWNEKARPIQICTAAEVETTRQAVWDSLVKIVGRN